MHGAEEQRPRGVGEGSTWLSTFGCSHNRSDSEYMAGLLSELQVSARVRPAAAVGRSRLHFPPLPPLPLPPLVLLR